MQWICRADFDMADVEVLTVRFHFNGEFVLDGSQMQYCDEDLGVSHIDKDKLSTQSSVAIFWITQPFIDLLGCTGCQLVQS